MRSLDIRTRRLTNQGLVRARFASAADVVRALGAVQAQDYLGAKWAVAQRASAAADAEVEQQIVDGAILRTHVLRPTWHFVAAADIRWLLALTAPRIRAAMAYHDRALELDPAVLRKSRAVLTKALRGDEHLTRTELASALTKAGVRADGTQRLAHLMMHAELDALVCSGARRGKQFTYALLEERVPAATMLERDEALRELALRYFTTRGPATEEDFAWWSGLTRADAIRAADSAEPKLDSAQVGKRRYWFPSTSAAKIESPLARLLPNYDEYFIGFKDRAAIAERLGKSGAAVKLSGLSGNLITIDGEAVGGWQRIYNGKSTTIELSPLTSLKKTERDAIKSEVLRFARFVGGPVELRES